MTTQTPQDLYTKLMNFLFFVDNKGAHGSPSWRTEILIAIGFSELIPDVTVYSPAIVFYGDLVKALTSKGKTRIVDFLEALQKLQDSELLVLGASDIALLDGL